MKPSLSIIAALISASLIADPAIRVHSAAPSKPMATPKAVELPRAYFKEIPAIENGKLKAGINFVKAANQNMTFVISLQTLSQYGDRIDESEVEKLISKGEFLATSTSNSLVEVGAATFNEALNRLGVTSANANKVRLKVTLTQGRSNPDQWQQANARIVFSPWLSFH